MDKRLIWAGLVILVIVALRIGFVDALLYFVISGHIRLFNFTVPPLAMFVLWTVIIPLSIVLVASRGFYLPKIELAINKLILGYLLKIACQYPELVKSAINTSIPDEKPTKPTKTLSRYLPIPQN